MKKRYITIILLCICTVIMSTCAVLQADQRKLAEKLVRLHVVANSDSDFDQRVKLEVRDAVLEQAQTVMDGSTDPKAELQKNLPMLEQAAERRLSELNVQTPVRVTLAKELFPTRAYDTFRLPSGVYTALRVTIGEGQGHNWWCVVFPSLCMTASMDELEQAAETAGFSDAELRLITEADTGYTIKFKTIELLQKLKTILDF